MVEKPVDSPRLEDVDKGASRRVRRPGDLTAIDDAEITGYLNNKDQMELKKIMWELMFKNYATGKRVKPASTNKAKKKAKSPAEKAAKIAGNEENKKKKTGLSSKINYNALKKFMEEEKEDLDSNTRGNGDADREEKCGGEEQSYGEGGEEGEYDYHYQGGDVNLDYYNEDDDGYGDYAGGDDDYYEY